MRLKKPTLKQSARVFKKYSKSLYSTKCLHASLDGVKKWESSTTSGARSTTTTKNWTLLSKAYYFQPTLSAIFTASALFSPSL